MADEHLTITLKSPRTETPPKRSGHVRRWRRMYAAGFALIVLGVLCVGGYLTYTRLTQVSSGTHVDQAVPVATPSASTNGDSQQVIARVGALMLLPDETPVIAVVSDLSKLKGQRFFVNAEEGDVVLMYPHAQKAILYSPTLNKIIEVAPITNDTQQ